MDDVQVARDDLPKVNVLGVPMAAIDVTRAWAEIERWVRDGAKTYVTVTGVHGIMASQDDKDLLRIHQSAGMCVPDGVPTVWIGHLRGHKNMRRVYGPDLMLEVMRRSGTAGITHFLFGGKEGVPELLHRRLLEKFPNCRIMGTLSPPFRAMTESEEDALRGLIAELRPDIIWVGLSTPKQERWMAAHVGRLDAKVMIGVGAAFDFHAGLLRQAPRWIQCIGMEWFFRLCMEPRRLWRRYLYNNPRFIWKVLLQLTGVRKYEIRDGGR
jgi:N-acetylglucosaminyldiphosphoundecaprenol N-acetyl-beta-D-mannosaminyltransferase